MKPESISTTCKRVLAYVLVLGLAAIATPRTHAQTFSVVHDFSGSDGGQPLSGFIMDAAGNLYGTASSGGSSNNGVVYKVNQRGQETVLYNFAGGTDGADPEASLFRDAAGNLYGTTYAGGTVGAGTVFKLTPRRKKLTLYNFLNHSDGANPQGTLTMDAAGNFYGTTTVGGSNGKGTIFRLKKIGKKWQEKIIYTFGSGTDGAMPVAGLTLDGAGNLYGTTPVGGTYGYGTVFELKRSKGKWTEQILYNFQMQSDGGVPYAGLIFDSLGNIYGAATEGGNGTDGGGTVFEMTPSQNGWTFTVLYSLPGWGISGTYRHLLMDAAGNLYGTTHCDGTNSAGTVYELILSNGTWTYNSLYVFTGGSDGKYSFSNLVFDKSGNLYGTTNQGSANGLGNVFKITP